MTTIKKELKKENFIDKKITTIYITLIVFAFTLGFFSGWTFSDKNLTEAQLNFQIIQLDMLSVNERIKFAESFDENICNSTIIEDLSSKIYNSGVELDKLDKSKKIETKYYNYLKQEHNVNQVIFYSQYKKYQLKCNSSNNIILFFFNSTKEEDAKIQGLELNNIQNKYNVRILAMDYKYTKSLSYFYEYYNITTLPALIINYEHTLEGQTNSKKIENYLMK